MNIIIMGCGRVGTEMARALAVDPSRHDPTRDRRVCLIERRRSRIEELPKAILEHPYISVVEGDGASNEALVAAGAEEADAFIAVSGDDRVNGLAAQKAKHFFQVGHVLLRVRDPELAQMYTDIGLTVFCPTAAAREFLINNLPDRMAEQ